MIVARPMELFFAHEIKHVVEACIILHNMMVEVQMERDQQEHGDFYQVLSDAHRRTDGDRAESLATVPPLRHPTTRERLWQLERQWQNPTEKFIGY